MTVKIKRRHGSWLIQCPVCQKETTREGSLAAVHDEVMSHVRGHRLYFDLERLGG